MALNHIQRDRQRRAVSLDDATSLRSPGSPAQSAERDNLAHELRAALDTLPTVQREIVLLHDLEGWQHGDVAVALGISITMSRRHLSDARRLLRARLGEYAALEPDHD